MGNEDTDRGGDSWRWKCPQRFGAQVTETLDVVVLRWHTLPLPKETKRKEGRKKEIKRLRQTRRERDREEQRLNG